MQLFVLSTAGFTSVGASPVGIKCAATSMFPWRGMRRYSPIWTITFLKHRCDAGPHHLSNKAVLRMVDWVCWNNVDAGNCSSLRFLREQRPLLLCHCQSRTLTLTFSFSSVLTQWEDSQIFLGACKKLVSCFTGCERKPTCPTQKNKQKNVSFMCSDFLSVSRNSFYELLSQQSTRSVFLHARAPVTLVDSAQGRHGLWCVLRPQSEPCLQDRGQCGIERIQFYCIFLFFLCVFYLYLTHSLVNLIFNRHPSNISNHTCMIFIKSRTL